MPSKTPNVHVSVQRVKYTFDVLAGLSIYINRIYGAGSKGNDWELVGTFTRSWQVTNESPAAIAL